MVRSFTAAVVLLALAGIISVTSPRDARAEESPQAKPAHQVYACYFHRTERCPTCKKISSLIETSLKQHYKEELADGQVVLRMIDFQDKKNQKYTDFYKVNTPTLIVMDVRDNKVTHWKPLPKVWTLVPKPADFATYVRDEVRQYLNNSAGPQGK